MVGSVVGRETKLLSPMEVRNLKGVGRHPVGRGLYLQITKADTRSWIFRYQLSGRRREIGLGSTNLVSLADARKVAKEYRELTRNGLDPKVKRDKEVQDNMLKQSWTFDMCVKAYIDIHSKVWSNPKHKQQWVNTLNTYASPVFGSLPVEEIDNKLMMRVLEPIWFTKTETATRVRSRIERVLSWSVVQGYRENPNPALWRGNLSELLPKASDVANEQHHAALPYNEVALFISELDRHTGIAAKALIFTIATACRTNEVIAASWDEINLDERVWSIPKERMKSNRGHRVPLNDTAIEVLKNLPKLSGWVFPSVQSGKHVGNMAMLKLLQKTMKRPDITVHGFRSTFKDWSAEISNYPRELSEAALAHKLKDKTEAAYQRGDLLEKRRMMMNDWGEYLNYSDVNVTRITQ